MPRRARFVNQLCSENRAFLAKFSEPSFRMTNEKFSMTNFQFSLSALGQGVNP
jgi:hypothetical protein